MHVPRIAQGTVRGFHGRRKMTLLMPPIVAATRSLSSRAVRRSQQSAKGRLIAMHWRPARWLRTTLAKNPAWTMIGASHGIHRGCMRLTSVILLASLAPASALAHSGGLDKSGCHTDRRTGVYHCHAGASTTPINDYAPRMAPAKGPAERAGAFANCAEAREAGRVPVRRGEPGYGPHLDRDNDGVGCEPYRGRR